DTEGEADDRTFTRRAGHARPLMSFAIPLPPPKCLATNTRNVTGDSAPLRTPGFGGHPPPATAQRAKAGGSPRCCPVLCGLRDRCIAAMLATRPRHEGGVEPPAARSVKS